MDDKCVSRKAPATPGLLENLKKINICTLNKKWWQKQNLWKKEVILKHKLRHDTKCYKLQKVEEENIARIEKHCSENILSVVKCVKHRKYWKSMKKIT